MISIVMRLTVIAAQCLSMPGKKEHAVTPASVLQQIYASALESNVAKSCRSYQHPERPLQRRVLLNNKGMKQALIHLDCAF